MGGFAPQSLEKLLKIKFNNFYFGKFPKHKLAEEKLWSVCA
jgi:hypothetical protein